MISDINGKFTLNNGVQMPYLGLGVYKADDGQQVIDSINWALDAGYRHIDTASFYGNESGVGKAVRESAIERSDIFVTTKVWNADQGYDTTLQAFDVSIKNMQLDYIDLYLVHWPVKGKFKETWRAFEEIYKSGKVKAIGVSNFLQFQLEDLMESANVVPAVNQMEFHPYLVQQSLIDFCKTNGIQYQSWSPLMVGGVMDIDLLKKLGAKYEKSPAQIVIRWNLQKGVIVIPKSVHHDRIIANANVFDFQLSNKEIKAIDALDKNERIGPDPANFDF